jgi:Tol biopolymer transport system component
MRCPYCDQEHPDTARFCPATGRPIELPQPIEAFASALSSAGSGKRGLWIASILLIAAAIMLFILANQPGPRTGELTGAIPNTPNARQKPTISASQTLPSRVSGGETRQATQSPSAAPVQSSVTPRTVTVAATPASTPTELSKAPGGRIVYASGEDILREILILDLDTHAVRQVTSNEFLDEAPSFSPDNQALAFSSNRDDAWNLFISDLDSGRERQLTFGKGQARFPEWSPVSGDDRILFEGRDTVGGKLVENIWMVDASSGELTQLTHSNSDLRPGWSPDGKKVVFGRPDRDSNHDGKVDASDFWDIYILDLASGQTTRLTSTPDVDEFQYAWSPDGEWIAFCAVTGDSNQDGFTNLNDSQDLYLIHPDGNGQRRIDLNGLRTYSPDWSPQGDMLLFTAFYGTSQSEVLAYDLTADSITRLVAQGPICHPEWER